MATLLNNIRMGTRDAPIWINHVINTEDDATHFINAETEHVYMSVNSSGVAIMADKNFGKFCMYDADPGTPLDFGVSPKNLWCFYRMDEKGFEDKTIPRYYSGNANLIKCEVKVFKELFDQGVIKVEDAGDVYVVREVLS